MLGASSQDLDKWFIIMVRKSVVPLSNVLSMGVTSYLLTGMILQVKMVILPSIGNPYNGALYTPILFGMSLSPNTDNCHGS